MDVAIGRRGFLAAALCRLARTSRGQGVAAPTYDTWEQLAERAEDVYADAGRDAVRLGRDASRLLGEWWLGLPHRARVLPRPAAAGGAFRYTTPWFVTDPDDAAGDVARRHEVRALGVSASPRPPGPPPREKVRVAGGDPATRFGVALAAQFEAIYEAVESDARLAGATSPLACVREDAYNLEVMTWVLCVRKP